MHIHYVELCMNETARILYSHTNQETMSRPKGAGESDGRNMSGSKALGFERFDVLWQSVGAIKAWVDVFLSLSPAEYAGLSFIQIAQLARCLMVLYRLSTFADPAWDCEFVQSTLNLLTVLDNVSDKLRVASTEAGERSSDDRFQRMSEMMHTFRTKSSAELGQKMTGLQTSGWFTGVETADAVAGGGTSMQNQAFWQPMMSPGDDAFLQSIVRDLGDEWTV